MAEVETDGFGCESCESTEHLAGKEIEKLDAQIDQLKKNCKEAVMRCQKLFGSVLAKQLYELLRKDMQGK